MVIVTGDKSVGKSTTLVKIASLLKEKGKTVGGVISPRIWKNNERYGYKLVNPQDGSSELLAAVEKIDGNIVRHCSFFFNKDVFDKGNSMIQNGINSDLLIVDEIGNLEIAGGGWAVSMPEVAGCNVRAVLSIREDVIDKAIEKWRLNPVAVYKITAENKEESAEKIVNMLWSEK